MQTKRELLVSDGWLQAVALVGLCGFLLLGILAYRTDTDEPSSKVIGPDGQLLFTGEDVLAGQEVLLKNGLMEYGSIFGHGAYLGPDFTGDYLHRAALRFWLVHLWVEDFLELFTTIMVDYMFVLLGVVRERVAPRDSVEPPIFSTSDVFWEEGAAREVR